MEALRSELRALIAREMQTDPAHDIAHLDRVWVNAHQISSGLVAGDQKVLLAASYLHDLVNLPKDAPNRAEASRLSAQKAESVLLHFGFSLDEITATQHAIVAHSFSAGVVPETLEAKILRDADRLDALGAIGIARTFLVSGQLARPLLDPEDPFAKQRPLDDQAWSLDHWAVKLLRLPEDMLTEVGCQIARDRVGLMGQFLEQLAQETGHDIPETWRAFYT